MAAKKTSKHHKRKLKRWNNIRTRYGITKEQYYALFKAQSKRCAICKTTNPGKGGWTVDHDHTTGAVRGILCATCNLMLGLGEDSPKIFKRALEYLNGPENVAQSPESPTRCVEETAPEETPESIPLATAASEPAAS